MRIELAMLLSVAVVAVAPLAAQQEGPARTRKPLGRIEQQCRDLIAASEWNRLLQASDERLDALRRQVPNCIKYASSKTRLDVLGADENIVAVTTDRIWEVIEQVQAKKRQEEQDKTNKMVLDSFGDISQPLLGEAEGTREDRGRPHRPLQWASCLHEEP